MKLQNRIGIVTGAAKGMGGAITRTLAREGADLLLAARDRGPLDALAEELRTRGRRAETMATDVTDETQVRAMVARAREAFGGRIDILVNVAGVTGPIETPAWQIAAEDFDEVLRNNVRGTFLPMKHVLPTMIEQRSGKIVNIGGTSGLRGYKYRTAYSASKWAVRGVTRTVALDAGEFGINVNVVCPGIVETPRMHKLCREKAQVRGWTYEEVYQEYVDEMALRRVTTPQDVADAVLFLASDESRNITGQELTVDGGWDV
ncbi:MAG: SDR family oxidoreductase [Gammaproteobacteria bacterium]|nr:SDR family oxidoreductase [Gammaproteobacteria bacterium]NIR85597.1 SDR family oxidoreductase [Gammaproteobacteria bacterium]NIR90038.1 SDR family oxidoreductase [Gammaproteobacteria bacterium]NIU06726.1 SDR family oxidoreductase [Gammaproteobacteria bacterium]NIV53657.1 SDR family oxidoreductase [Gammaproteobacteria bacterium]